MVSCWVVGLMGREMGGEMGASMVSGYLFRWACIRTILIIYLPQVLLAMVDLDFTAKFALKEARIG